MRNQYSATGKKIVFAFAFLITLFISKSFAQGPSIGSPRANLHFADKTFSCTPPAQPTALVLTAFPNVVTGVFVPPIVPGTGYIVIRTSTPAAPTAPVNGVVYTAGTTALGGYVESVGSATTFTSTSLLPGTQYYYWVYSYSTAFPCSSITYNQVSPLVNTVNTLLCGLTNNTVVLPETGSVVWSTLVFNMGHLPTACEDVTVILNGILPLDLTVNLSINADVTVHNLTLINNSISTTNDKIFRLIVQPGVQLNITGDLVIEGAGARSSDSVILASRGITNITGNATIGKSTDISPSAIGSYSTGTDQTINFGGDITFNSKASVSDKRTLFTMNGSGVRTITNNTSSTGGKMLLFDKLRIGDGTNTPAVTLAGSNANFYMNDNGGSLRVMNGSSLIIPAGFSFNAKDVTAAGVFNSALLLDNNATLKLGGNSGGYTGNNFPANYNTNTINAGSTTEYNGSNAITQTVYNGVNYGTLSLTNGSGSGRAQKITSAEILTNANVNVNALTDFTPGFGVNTAGAFTVYSTAGLYCGANVINGTGTFNLQSNATIGIGHAQGITASSAAGNVQLSGGRTFSNNANYIYYGTVPQVTGNGLPSTCRDLIIDNPTTVASTAAVTVTGAHTLKQGIFDIGTNRINVPGVLSTVSGKMKANLGALELSSNAGAQTISGSWFVNRNISTLINSNTSGITLNATANDTLAVSSALLYGGATTNSVINTNNNLTLLSRDSATARFGEIKTGSNNSISGNVNVERYVGTSRKWRLLSWPVNNSQTAMQSWMENNAVANANGTPGYGVIVTDEKATWNVNGFDSRSASGPSVKYWDASINTFTGIPNTTSYQMNNNSAYYVYVRGDRSCLPSNSALSSTILRTTGTLKTGNRSFNIPAGEFAAIGNPYASAVDFRGLDTANLTGTFYVWDAKLTGIYGQGAYQTIYTSGSDYRVIPGGGSYGSFGTLVDTLESGQGFFAKARATAGTVTFKESAKTIGARTVSRQQNNTPVVFAVLGLSDPGNIVITDGMLAAFGSEFSNNADDDDAVKMPNNSENVSFKRNGSLLAVERRQQLSADDTLFVNMTGMRIHAYNWNITTQFMPAGLTAFLLDRYANLTTPLANDVSNNIVFNVTGDAASYASDRFIIVLKPAAVLPVRFTSISATRNNDKTVAVKYTAETEMSIDHYTIQYSTDGTHFKNIGTQLPSANNGGSASYTYADGQASAATCYYRVQSTDANGRIQYTAIAKVSALNEAGGISIYPNPVVDGVMNIRFSNKAKGRYAVSVINEIGQVIRRTSVNVAETNTTITVQLDANTAAGTYRAVITDESGKNESTGFIIK